MIKTDCDNYLVVGDTIGRISMLDIRKSSIKYLNKILILSKL